MKNLVQAMPSDLSTRVVSTQEEFDAVLMNPDLFVVEKTFHNKFECNHVLFVLTDSEIDFIIVKEITENGTKIYKEF